MCVHAHTHEYASEYECVMMTDVYVCMRARARACVCVCVWGGVFEGSGHTL